MAKKQYIGVSNIARNCPKAYVGVNNIARKIKKAYIGVDGIAKQFYAAETPTTTAELHFSLNNFSSSPTSVVSTVSGSATTILQDGTRPTMTITTTASKGFRRGSYSSTYSGYENTSAVNNSTYEDTISDINSIFARTSASTKYYVFFRTGTSTSNNTTKTFTFDFKNSRTLTLNVYYSWCRADGTYSSWAGSNDGTTWTTIQSKIDSGSTRTITNNTPYRYFKYTSQSYYQHGIALMYFTNISDTIYS